MGSDDDAVVTLHVLRMPARKIPATLWAVAGDRGRLRAVDGVRFAKILGVASGMSPRQADPTRWVLLLSWTSAEQARAASNTPAVASWQQRCAESWSVTLRPMYSRGRWSGSEPWPNGTPAPATGPVVAVTRARLRPSRVRTFWRAARPVVTTMAGAPGLLAAFGIGEAPIAVQGTVSVWSDVDAMHEFAYRGDAHRRVIDQTRSIGWYAEELFAHFAVVESRGTLDGRNPLQPASPIEATP